MLIKKRPTKFRDYITLYYNDPSLQRKYMIEKYKFWLLLTAVISIFITGCVVLSVELHYMLETKEIDYSFEYIILISIPTGILLILWLLLMYLKTRSLVFNIIISIFFNLAFYVIFESIKITYFWYQLKSKNLILIDVLHFLIRFFWILLVDDTFIYQLFSFICFVPLYFIYFTNQYRNEENQENYFIAMLSGLVIASYIYEMFNKSRFYSLKNILKQDQKNMDLMDNVKSGYLIINLHTNTVESNKAFKKKFGPNLLKNFEITDEDLEVEHNNTNNIETKDKNKHNDYQEDSEIEDLEYKHYFEFRKKQNQRIIEKPKEISMKAALNCIFSNTKKVNSYDFDGNLKKEINDFNNGSKKTAKKYTSFFKKFNKSKFLQKSPTKKGNNDEVNKKESNIMARNFLLGGIFKILLSKNEELFKEITEGLKKEQEEKERKAKNNKNPETIILVEDSKSTNLNQKNKSIYSSNNATFNHSNRNMLPKSESTTKRRFNFTKKLAQRKSEVQKKKTFFEDSKFKLREIEDFVPIIHLLTQYTDFLTNFRYLIMKSVDMEVELNSITNRRSSVRNSISLNDKPGISSFFNFHCIIMCRYDPESGTVEFLFNEVTQQNPFQSLVDYNGVYSNLNDNNFNLNGINHHYIDKLNRLTCLLKQMKQLLVKVVVNSKFPMLEIFKALNNCLEVLMLKVSRNNSKDDNNNNNILISLIDYVKGLTNTISVVFEEVKCFLNMRFSFKKKIDKLNEISVLNIDNSNIFERENNSIREVSEHIENQTNTHHNLSSDNKTKDLNSNKSKSIHRDSEKALLEHETENHISLKEKNKNIVIVNNQTSSSNKNKNEQLKLDLDSIKNKYVKIDSTTNKDHNSKNIKNVNNLGSSRNFEYNSYLNGFKNMNNDASMTLNNYAPYSNFGRIKKELISLKEICEESLIMFESKAKLLELKLSFKYYISNNLQETIISDKKKLKQSIFNLLLNSIDSMKNKNQGFCRLVLDSNPKRINLMRVSVMDEGVSIPVALMNMFNENTSEEIVNNVFPYYPFSGLLVVKKYTEMLGSEIMITKNKSNNGTTVWFTIKLFNEVDVVKIKNHGDSSFSSDDKNDSDIDIDKGIPVKNIAKASPNKNSNNNIINIGNEYDTAYEKDKFNDISHDISQNPNNQFGSYSNISHLYANPQKPIALNNYFSNNNNQNGKYIDSLFGNINIYNNINNSYIQTPKNKKLTSLFSSSYAFKDAQRRIIIADTDASNRGIISKFMSELFTKNNVTFQIIEAKDGAEIMQILYHAFEEDKYIDAVIFDEEMNFISGELLGEFFILMKKRSIIPEAMCLFITGHFEIKKTELKDIHFILKPVEISSIKYFYEEISRIKPL